MKRIIVFLLLLFALPAWAEELMSTNGVDTAWIADGPCDASVLKHIPQGDRGYYRAARAQADGKQWIACWVLRPDQVVLIVYTDGTLGLIHSNHFKAVPAPI